MLTNLEIAAVFRGIASLLEKKKENWFKIRAYRKVAEEIEKLAVELSQLAKEDKLREIPGVGEAIEKKITEMLNTGQLQFYEKLKADVGVNNSGQVQK
jgi:DNA polymerase (family 10)